MTTSWNLHAIAQMSAERMLNCLAEGIVIALFAWMLLRLIGRRNSGTRFAVWFCALIAIAVSPFLQTSANGSDAWVRPAGAAITVPRSWAFYLFGAWAAMAAVGLARVAVGLWHLRTIRSRCGVLEGESLHPTLVRTLGEFRSVRAVEICVSDELRVPTAVGFFRPVVVFPAWSMRELSETELNTVLLHELAHLQRWDDWTNLAQKVLRALFFFHPAVWWVESRLSLEREMACDDIVLAHTANPRAYAKCLVSLAEKNRLRRGMGLAQAAVGRMRQTTQRLLQILDAGRPNAVRVWKPAPWVVGAFSIACLVSSAHAPRLVAFGDASPAVAVQAARRGGPARVQPARAQEDASRMGAQLVPASFVERTTVHGVRPRQRNAQPGNQGTAVAVETTDRSQRRSLQPQVAPPATRIVQTSAPAMQTPAPQQAVFVFMEGRQYGDSGAVLWHISVWRIVLPAQGQVAENPSKST
jgi:beta-lactamase regulating signal transducer with metallopeptidase domain